MDGWEYEELCAEYLRRIGYTDVDVTSGSGDQGVDIIAVNNGERYGIQCKYYSDPVSNKAVQEVFAGCKYYGCDKGIVMTNNIFTKSAQELAQTTGVLLWGNMTIENISSYSSARKESLKTISFLEIDKYEEILKTKYELPIIIGQKNDGNIYIDELCSLNNILIVGATGTGKTTCMNVIITTLSTIVHPQSVRYIMIDLKDIEFGEYNRLPHMFCPTISDTEVAIASLAWVKKEIENRYKKFVELKVRNISGYNEKNNGMENAVYMPHLIIFIDEIAEIINSSMHTGTEILLGILQRGRAAGIHLVISTNWISGIPHVILEQMPNRIVFSVSSIKESKKVLDIAGAEKITTEGEILYKTYCEQRPVHIKCVRITEEEIENRIDYLQQLYKEYAEKLPNVLHFSKEQENEVEEKTNVTALSENPDAYFEEAGYFVIKSGRAAVGQLQRKFSIGFNRAGRIIDQLNKAGVIGPAVGTSPRAVLMNLEQFNAYLGKEPEGRQDVTFDYNIENNMNKEEKPDQTISNNLMGNELYINSDNQKENMWQRVRKLFR